MVGVPPVHTLSAEERNRAPKVEDLRVDLGLAAERIREVVRPGDVVTRARSFAPLGDLVSGKALDDRVGVFVLIEARPAAGESAVDVRATATVQEEVGLRGARVAAARQSPDIGVAIHTCPSTDGPGRPARWYEARCGSRNPHHGRQRDRVTPAAVVSRGTGDRAGHSPPIPRLGQGWHQTPSRSSSPGAVQSPAAYRFRRATGIRRSRSAIPATSPRPSISSPRSSNRRTASRPRTEPPYPPWTDPSVRISTARAPPGISAGRPSTNRLTPVTGLTPIHTACVRAKLRPTPDASVPANRTVPWTSRDGR